MDCPPVLVRGEEQVKEIKEEQKEVDDKIEVKDESSFDIPSHLPKKQRELFIRIQQQQLKEKEKAEREKAEASKKEENIKEENDNWSYSSDEEDDKKPDIPNILKSLTTQGSTKEPQPDASQSPSSGSGGSSTLNVMQMINAIKSQSSSTPSSRPTDPRQKPESTEPSHVPPVPHREPTQINSREGDCPYRMIRVLYVKQRIPTNISLSDSKYKNDPRVQKMLRQQELESGIVIDHSGISVKPSDPRAKAETTKGLPEPKFPLLDNVKKEPSLPRPELAPFVDPRPKLESRPELPPFVDPRINSDPRIKPEISDTRPQDPRTRPMDVNNIVSKPSDPRLQRMSSNQGIATHNMPGMGLHNLPVRPMDPRLARQDSNSSASGRPMDPRLSRQTSRDMSGSNLGSSPSDPRLSKTSSVSEGMNDPRLLGRQTSDPRLSNMDSSSESFSTNKPFDPRLGRMLDTDSGPPSVLRQMSQPNTVAEKASVDTKSDSKPKLDYRNDPRFKRKPISESNLSPSSIVKRSSQTDRKSSTDYISPLGGDNSRTEENTGYNSYNRPRPPKPVPQNASAPKIQITPDMVPKASEDISTHDILDSLKILSPPVMEHSSSSSDKHLKDIFKTIDPTASPFC